MPGGPKQRVLVKHLLLFIILMRPRHCMALSYSTADVILAGIEKSKSFSYETLD